MNWARIFLKVIFTPLEYLFLQRHWNSMYRMFLYQHIRSIWTSIQTSTFRSRHHAVSSTRWAGPNKSKARTPGNSSPWRPPHIHRPAGPPLCGPCGRGRRPEFWWQPCASRDPRGRCQPARPGGEREK